MAIDDSIELDSNNSNTESSAFLPQLLTPRYVCMHATLLLPFVCLVIQTLMYVMYIIRYTGPRWCRSCERVCFFRLGYPANTIVAL